MGVLSLESLKNFLESKYARNLIFKTDNVEIILMCWLPGQGTPMHDHGRSDALTMVIEGEMSCTTLLEDGSSQRSILHKGEIEHIPVGIQHEARNNAQSDLVTLHIYSPPLEADIKEKILSYDNLTIEKSVELEHEVRKYLVGSQRGLDEDTSSQKKRRHNIVVIGAGFSGSLVVSHLLKSHELEDTQVILIERGAKFARGFAYSTSSTYHLLNVPAGKMSAFPDQPDHFLKWAQQTDSSISANTFVPRMMYGEYLESVLQESNIHKSQGISFKRINDEAVSLSIDERRSKARIHLESSIEVEADQVVLAVGNYPSKNPSTKHQEFYESSLYSKNPWAADSLSGLKPNDNVLLVGTGLTMVDKAIELNAKKHHGKIYCLSRHGLVPQKHNLNAGQLKINADELLSCKTLRELLRYIRKEIATHCKDEADGTLWTGSDWRALIDALRPYTQELWKNLSLSDKKRFFRHLRPYWDVHRHRIPSQSVIVFDTMMNSGQLELIAGRIQDYKIEGTKTHRESDSNAASSETKVAVTFIERHSGETKTIKVAKVINCTGSEMDFCQIQDPLIVNLIKQGLINSDEMSLGLEANEHGALIDKDSKISKVLYTLGPPLKGQLWESTAVPELRSQAKNLASHLADQAAVAARRLIS